MMRSDVPLGSWSSPAPLAGNTGLYLSRSVSAKQSGWLYRISGLMQERVYIVQTPVRDTSRCDQRLEAAPHWHMVKHITKRQWRKPLVNEESRYGKMTSLWTCAKLKPALFRANTLHTIGSFQSHQQSTEENTLFRVICVAAI